MQHSEKLICCEKKSTLLLFQHPNIISWCDFSHNFSSLKYFQGKWSLKSVEGENWGVQTHISTWMLMVRKCNWLGNKLCNLTIRFVLRYNWLENDRPFSVLFWIYRNDWRVPSPSSFCCTMYKLFWFAIEYWIYRRRWGSYT